MKTLKMSKGVKNAYKDNKTWVCMISSSSRKATTSVCVMECEDALLYTTCTSCMMSHLTGPKIATLNV